MSSHSIAYTLWIQHLLVGRPYFLKDGPLLISLNQNNTRIQSITSQRNLIEDSRFVSHICAILSIASLNPRV